MRTTGTFWRLCCKANMVELKQTKLSDRSTVGRVWDSEFEDYRFDSGNRQIFDSSENSKIYFQTIFNQFAISKLSFV